jgi:hypothetical protein
MPHQPRALLRPPSPGFAAAIAIAIGLAMPSSAARAAPASPPIEWPNGRFRFGVVAGYFTPVGVFGFDLQYDLTHALAISGGVGGALGGGQLAFMIRLHHPGPSDAALLGRMADNTRPQAFNEPRRINLGVGLSGGPYFALGCDDACAPPRDRAFALWGNGELSVEVVTHEAFIRLFAGLSVLLNDHPSLEETDQRLYPYAGLTLGRRFSIR